MIIVALGMVVILGFAALVIDLGHAYSQRRLAQNAADASALAAIRMVRMRTPSTTSLDVHNEIVRVAALNGSAQVVTDEFLDVNRNSLGSVISYPGADLGQVAGVRVVAQIQYQTLFAGVVGINSLTSGGRATAMSLAVGGVTGIDLLPIAVPSHPYGDPSQNYDPDAPTPYTIWTSDSSSRPAPGNVGWLDFDAGSSPSGQLAGWLDGGFQSSPGSPFTYYENGGTPGPEHESATLPLPSWLQGDTGLSNSSDVRTALNGLDDAGGQSVTVLLFDTVEGSGQGARYRIVGMAQFRIETVNTGGNPETITARFERMVYPGDPSSTPTTSDSSTVRLTN